MLSYICMVALSAIGSRQCVCSAAAGISYPYHWMSDRFCAAVSAQEGFQQAVLFQSVGLCAHHVGAVDDKTVLLKKSGGKLLFPISFLRNDKKPIVLMEIFIDNYVQMRYNLFTLYKKYCIFCFMAISHKESAADVLSDFSSDCLKIPQEY